MLNCTRWTISDFNIFFLFVVFFLIGAPAEAPSPLLNWDIVHEKMPWNILLLLGGGYALAHGSEVTQLSVPDVIFLFVSDWILGRWCLFSQKKKSGLSLWLGERLIPLQSIPPFAISILLSLLVAMFTECSSNTATTTLFLPILASMVRLNILLFYLHIHVCTCWVNLFFIREI